MNFSRDAKISVLNNLRRILCVSFPPMPDSTDVVGVVLQTWCTYVCV